MIGTSFEWWGEFDTKETPEKHLKHKKRSKLYVCDD
jgi:hypothetical protein